MNIDNLITLDRNQPSEERRQEIRRDQTAKDFEEIFARHLVEQMTKDSFGMSDESQALGQSNALYREFITDALAGELAAQRKLGMADMVEQYWDRQENKHDQGQQEISDGISSGDTGAHSIKRDSNDI